MASKRKADEHVDSIAPCAKRSALCTECSVSSGYDVPVAPNTGNRMKRRGHVTKHAVFDIRNYPISMHPLLTAGDGQPVLLLAEGWHPVRDTPTGEICFRVSNDGIITEASYEKALRLGKAVIAGQGHTREGYVVFTSNGKYRLEHRLRMAAALGVAYQELQGLEVDHRDQNRRHDNSLSNLQLLTLQQHRQKTHRDHPNMGKKTGAKQTKQVQQLALDGTLIRTFDSLKQARHETGIIHISDAARGIHRKMAGGFRWRFTGQPTDKDIAELAQKATEWKPVRLPCGTLLPQLQVSDNQLLRTSRGVITRGKKTDRGYYMWFIRHTSYLAHEVLWCSWYGTIPRDKLIMHTGDDRENVTIRTLKLGTERENAIEAHGVRIRVTNMQTHEAKEFASTGLAAAYAGLRDISHRLISSRFPRKASHFKFERA